MLLLEKPHGKLENIVKFLSTGFIKCFYWFYISINLYDLLYIYDKGFLMWDRLVVFIEQNWNILIVKVDIRKERRTRHYLRGWHTLRRRSGRGWGSVFPPLWEEKGQAGRSKVLPRHARSSGWGRTELQSWWPQRHTKQDINHSSIFLFWTFRDSGRLKNPIFEQGNGKLRNGKLKKQLSEEFERQIDQSLWFTL